MANIGLYPVGGASKYYMLNSVPTATKGNLDGIAPQNVRGTVREQDVIPTFRQSTEGVASGSETPPTARATWRGFPGSFGLLKQSDAPGDLTRAWISDADTTRAGQITAWLQWPGGSTVTVDAGPSGAPQALAALVNAFDAWGFVAQDSVAFNWHYWKWNGTKFARQRQVQGSPAAGTTTGIGSSRLPAYVWGGATGSSYPIQTVQQTDTSLWMALLLGGGCTDISVAAAAGVGVANAIATFVYFDILFVIASVSGDLTITPYRPRIPGAGNVLQSATLSGLANCLGTITGESAVMGVIPCEGAVYIVTDRSVYAMQWNDNNNTILITKLFELGRITSAPCLWNGEVYIGADNRIAHIVPNQRGYDWRGPDALGVTPPPYSGTIAQLIASPDALFAVTSDTSTNNATPPSGAILRMDANGVWSCPYLKTTKALECAVVPVQDGAHPYGLAVLNDASNVFTSATVLPMPAAGRNPRTLIVAQRAQRPGPYRLISPYFDLEAEGAQKLLQRFAQAVLDASASFPIRAYYQTDFADEAAADTFTTGCAKGTGTWHKCFYAAASSSAYAGSTDSGGRGQLWFEFDGSTVYADSIGTLTRYPTYKRVRFCLEVNGDTTGTTVPTILTTLFDRIEFVTKAFQRVYVLRLQTNEGNPHSPANGGSDAVSMTTSAALIAEFNRLKGYDGGKTLLTEVNEKGETRTVVMTKFDGALAAVGPDGAPTEYTVTVTVLDGALTGLS